MSTLKKVISDNWFSVMYKTYQQEEKMHPQGSSCSLSIFRVYSFQNCRLFPLWYNLLPRKKKKKISHIFSSLLFGSMAVGDLRKRQMSWKGACTAYFSLLIRQCSYGILLHLCRARIQK